MPPADPTPPLTAERLAVAEQCFISGDSGAEVEAIGRELLAAHAALTAQLAQRTAERDALRTAIDIVARISRATHEHSKDIAYYQAEVAGLVDRVMGAGERDELQREVRRLQDVRDLFTFLAYHLESPEAQPALAAALAAPTEG